MSPPLAPPKSLMFQMKHTHTHIYRVFLIQLAYLRLNLLIQTTTKNLIKYETEEFVAAAVGGGGRAEN